MIHIRTDCSEFNCDRKFACGIGPALPDGDKWVYEDEAGLHGMVDCPGCSPRKQSLGWSASQMDGNAANRVNNPDGWASWVAFCNANGAP